MLCLKIWDYNDLFLDPSLFGRSNSSNIGINYVAAADTIREGLNPQLRVAIAQSVLRFSFRLTF